MKYRLFFFNLIMKISIITAVMVKNRIVRERQTKTSLVAYLLHLVDIILLLIFTE